MYNRDKYKKWKVSKMQIYIVCNRTSNVTINTKSSVLRSVWGIRDASPASALFYFTRRQHVSAFWPFLQIFPQIKNCGADPHSSDELRKLSQWCSHEDSTIKVNTRPTLLDKSWQNYQNGLISQLSMQDLCVCLHAFYCPVSMLLLLLFCLCVCG